MMTKNDGVWGEKTTAIGYRLGFSLCVLVLSWSGMAISNFHINNSNNNTANDGA